MLDFPIFYLYMYPPILYIFRFFHRLSPANSSQSATLYTHESAAKLTTETSTFQNVDRILVFQKGFDPCVGLGGFLWTL
jgi:hypothetical protein